MSKSIDPESTLLSPASSMRRGLFHDAGGTEASLARSAVPNVETIAMRMILPPTYLLVSLVLATALSVFLPGPRIVASPWTVIGIGLIVIGVGINIVGDRQFQRAKTTMNPFGSPRTLVTTGVFRCFPHPMYAGLVLIVIGTAVLLGYATPFIAPVLLWTVLRYRFIPQEERVLSQRFGEEYRVYRTRVSRWL